MTKSEDPTVRAAPPAVDGLLETALYVSDLARSVDFYRRIFGFELMHDSERLCALDVAGRDVLLLVRRGSSTDAVDTEGGRIPPHDATGRIHFAFAVAEEALEPWEAWLEARGVAVESRVRWGRGGRSLYFRDPDGHLVELVSPGTWPIF